MTIFYSSFFLKIFVTLLESLKYHHILMRYTSYFDKIYINWWLYISQGFAEILIEEFSTFLL